MKTLKEMYELIEENERPLIILFIIIFGTAFLCIIGYASLILLDAMLNLKLI